MSSTEPTVQQLFDLSGKTALVTGASGHLGSAIARALAEAGASVIAASRDAERAQTAAERLPSPGGARHFGVRLDHMDEAALNRGFDEALEKTGGIDILINNGHEGSAADWTNVTGEEFNRQLANATGYFLLSRRLREQATERDVSASIVLLGSMYGMVASYPDAYEGVFTASPVAYHALKGGLIHMTRHLAVYWAKDNIRVNCLSPGPFPPAGRVPDEMVRRLTTKSPMGRMGEPFEIKGTVLFLASDASSYITGQNIVIDGGWTAW